MLFELVGFLLQDDLTTKRASGFLAGFHDDLLRELLFFFFWLGGLLLPQTQKFFLGEGGFIFSFFLGGAFPFGGVFQKKNRKIFTRPVFPTKKDYFFETYILSTNHYQIELLTNLDQVPEAGALVVVSFPKPKGGSGFPARVFAILP